MTDELIVPDSDPNSDDEILFADEEGEDGDESPPWPILVVDDEDDVHSMTADRKSVV